MWGLIIRWPQAEIFGTGYYILKDGEMTSAPISLDQNFKEGLIVYHETYDKSEDLCMPLTANSFCVTRWVFNEAGGYRTDLTLGEDSMLWLKITLKYPLAFINKPLSVYCHDVDPKYRAIGKKHVPKSHVVFHLDEFKEEENATPLLKKFLDRLRVCVLNEYYFINEFHQDVVKVADEVDWKSQPWYYCLMYKNKLFPKFLKRLLHRCVDV